MEVETDGGLGAEAADPFETIFAKRGEKQHKSGKKKVVSDHLCQAGRKATQVCQKESGKWSQFS